MPKSAIDRGYGDAGRVKPSIGTSARTKAHIKNLEDQLTESNLREQLLQSRLDDFATASGGWFWETDCENKFSYVSQSIRDLSGTDPEWFYGKSREDITVPELLTPGAWEAHQKELRRCLPFTGFVFQSQVPQGRKWMNTSGIPRFDSDARFLGYRGAAHEVTAEINERNKAARLAAAIQELDEFFVLWDAEDRLVISNRRFQEINVRVIATTRPGTRFEDHIRAALEAGLFPQAEGREEEWFQQRLAQHRTPGAPVELERQNGDWLLLSEQRLPDGSTITKSTDISEQKRLEFSLQELASYDSLTRVYNRRKFLELAEEALAETANPADGAGLILFDIDRFKTVNDTHGHQVGDEALEFVAQTVQACLGPNSFIGRIGGEEFAIFLSKAEAAVTRKIADRIRRSVEASPFVHAGIRMRLTVSVGAVSAPKGKFDLTDGLAAADALLYRAKHDGRNRSHHEILSKPQ